MSKKNMNKLLISVPSNIRFISEWKDYEIPQGKCIIDKKVCGCGYTQFCLTNKDNIILCSPRISLLENKAEQNPHCHYFRSIILRKKDKIKLGLDSDSQVSSYLFDKQRTQVFDYLQECKLNCIPPKFLVTYDSLPKLLEILVYLKLDLNYFKIIVDEFQLIFSDARFKADIELDFINYLNLYCSNICFLSSTPMLEEYLIQLDQFKNLTYYEFSWDRHQIITPNIFRVKADNLEQSIIELITLYKEGKGPVKTINGVFYQSTEAVFYVSNVSMITSVIKKTGLTPEEVNIICSKNDDNLRKIKKCGKGFGYGKIPLKGESCKMFTFCTSTAFCGVDFYSTNAKSYVFSNCNLDTMVIDISIELPQIIGRQRLPENVFRFDVGFYYQTCIRDFSVEEFNAKIEEKNKITYDRIKNFELLSEIGGNIDDQRKLIRSRIDQYQYSEDFCGIDKTTGLPIYNNLVYLSDLRAWELQNLIYNNDVSVLRVLDKVGDVERNDNLFIENLASLTYFEDKMKKVVDHLSDHPEDIDKVPEVYKIYLDNFSLLELKAGSLRKDDLDKRLKLVLGDKKKDSLEMALEVYEVFVIGEMYSRRETKLLLTKIFSKYNLSATSPDIMLYFETKLKRITNKTTGQREDSYLLIKRKY